MWEGKARESSPCWQKKTAIPRERKKTQSKTQMLWRAPLLKDASKLKTIQAPLIQSTPLKYNNSTKKKTEKKKKIIIQKNYKRKTK